MIHEIAENPSLKGVDWLGRIDPILVSAYEVNRMVDVRSACEKELSNGVKIQKLNKRLDWTRGPTIFLVGTLVLLILVMTGERIRPECTMLFWYITVPLAIGMTMIIFICVLLYRRWNKDLKVIKKSTDEVEAIRLEFQKVLSNLGAFTTYGIMFLTGVSWHHEGVFTSQHVKDEILKMRSEEARNQRLHTALIVNQDCDEAILKIVAGRFGYWTDRLEATSLQLPLLNLTDETQLELFQDPGGGASDGMLPAETVQLVTA